MGLLHSLVANSLPLVPKPIVHRVASRYVAGEALDEALGTIRQLEQSRLEVTLALLGEEVADRETAESAVAEYLRVLDVIRQEGLQSHISIKLTLIGLEIDEDYCYSNLEKVVAAAHEHDNFVRIDMEDHTCTSATLRLYRRVRERYGNVGTVLQSYLHRTLDDIRSELPAEGANIRLCKGIYIEPEEIAFTGHQQIRDNFVRALEELFDHGVYTAIATHDEWLIERALESIERRSLGSERYEFQTLLGVTEPLRDRLRDGGHRVRVYVPYGADWYAYSVRRLRENPKIAIYVMKAMFGG